MSADLTAEDRPEVDDVHVDRFEDFDAYWEQREAAARPAGVRIRGVDILAPTDLPIEMQLRPEKWQNAETGDELRALLDILIGEDVVEDLAEAGVGLRELQLLVTWAMAHGRGRRVTLAEADEILTQAEADEAKKTGKALPPSRGAMPRPRRSGGASRRAGR